MASSSCSRELNWEMVGMQRMLERGAGDRLEIQPTMLNLSLT